MIKQLSLELLLINSIEVDRSIRLIDGLTPPNEDLDFSLESEQNKNLATLASFSNHETFESKSYTQTLISTDVETSRQNNFTHLVHSLITLDIMLNQVPNYSSSIPNFYPYRDLAYIANFITTGGTFNESQIPPFGKTDERLISEQAYLAELQHFLIKIRTGLQLADNQTLNTEINPNRVENLFRDINSQYVEPLRIQLMDSYYLEN